ncbi:hypothetical protein ACN93_20690 [Gordonia paraffinivorans]|uniref:DUF5995 family protein n=1 Tax=Gordonia paraffinivorans TaxID=175628 RepID=UPI000D605492|nr:DUF5995 family protein [Gordonia paraffinivorans]PWD41252.1 hypothetical protein ACN93_20690 [Gordonia paraffinivorans]
MNVRRALCAGLVAASVLVGGAGLVGAEAAAAPATRCVPASTPESEKRLAELADVSGIKTFDDARTAISNLRKELSTSDNYLGTFPIAFDNILQLVGPSIASGTYDDPEWAEALAVEVVRLYVGNLHEFVTGGTPQAHWAEAFKLTKKCDRSPGRVLLGQIFAHLIVDFPYALENIGTTAEHTRDYYAFGNALVDATPTIVRDVKKTYGVDLHPLFTAWFLGDVIGDSQATTLLFQSTRTVALVNNFGLQNPATRGATVAEIDAMYRTSLFALDQMENLGQI